MHALRKLEPMVKGYFFEFDVWFLTIKIKRHTLNRWHVCESLRHHGTPGTCLGIDIGPLTITICSASDLVFICRPGRWFAWVNYDLSFGWETK